MREKFHLTKEIVDDVIHALEEQGEYIDTDTMDYKLPDPKDIVFYAIVMEKRKEEDAYLVTGNMNETIDYYEKNAEDFANGTLNIDFSEMQDMFLGELRNGAAILDFGCGSGRDAKIFLEKGYQVTALDGSAELCRIAEENAGIPVIHMDFNDFDERNRYDGIWACSSILHLPKDELKNVLIHMEKALREDGIIYTSFKYGKFSGMRNGRFFSDFTEDSFADFISEIGQLVIEKIWVTSDVRPGRQDEKWLNLLLRTVRG